MYGTFAGVNVYKKSQIFPPPFDSFAGGWMWLEIRKSTANLPCNWTEIKPSQLYIYRQSEKTLFLLFLTIFEYFYEKNVHGRHLAVVNVYQKSRIFPSPFNTFSVSWRKLEIRKSIVYFPQNYPKIKPSQLYIYRLVGKNTFFAIFEYFYKKKLSMDGILPASMFIKEVVFFRHPSILFL